MFGSRMDPGDIRDDDLAAATRRADDLRAWSDEAQDRIDEITGIGEAASGKIKVTVDANGRVLDTCLEPRALRLGSQALSEHLVECVRLARRDAERKVYDLMREAFDDFDPVAARTVIERLIDGR